MCTCISEGLVTSNASDTLKLITSDKADVFPKVNFTFNVDIFLFLNYYYATSNTPISIVGVPDAASATKSILESQGKKANSPAPNAS